MTHNAIWVSLLLVLAGSSAQATPVPVWALMGYSAATQGEWAEWEWYAGSGQWWSYGFCSDAVGGRATYVENAVETAQAVAVDLGWRDNTGATLWFGACVGWPAALGYFAASDGRTGWLLGAQRPDPSGTYVFDFVLGDNRGLAAHGLAVSEGAFLDGIVLGSCYDNFGRGYDWLRVYLGSWEYGFWRRTK